MKKKTSRIQTEINDRLGASIRRHRLDNNLTIADVSMRIDVSFQQYQKYEMGHTGINLARLMEIAKVFDVSVYDLLEPVIGERDTDTPQQKRIGRMIREIPSTYLKHIEGILKGMK